MKKLDLQDLAGFITLGILFMLFWPIFIKDWFQDMNIIYFFILAFVFVVAPLSIIFGCESETDAKKRKIQEREELKIKQKEKEEYDKWFNEIRARVEEKRKEVIKFEC